MWEAITDWRFIEETLGTVFTVLGLWIGYLSVKRVGRRVVREMAGRGRKTAPELLRCGRWYGELS